MKLAKIAKPADWEKQMSEKSKIRIVVDEDADIVARIDEMAEREGLSRADMLRRALRRMLFSMPNVPTAENFPTVAEPTAA